MCVRHAGADGCSFGAVLEEFEVRDAMMAALAGKGGTMVTQ
jgi:hypothetical protein